MPLVFPFTVRDPVHGLMLFTELERAIIDLPIFQRLRGLKQSSLANLTYPTALTTRFEHSLGAGHVAGRILDHLKTAYPQEWRGLVEQMAHLYGAAPEEAFEDQVVQAVRVAALLHDIGHLPFSHCFEHTLALVLGAKDYAKQWGETEVKLWEESQLGIAAIPNQPKFHEFLGVLIIERHTDVKKAFGDHKALISFDLLLDLLGAWRPGRAQNRTLQDSLGRIVHGEVDADRIDFVRRDGRMSGSGFGAFDIDRIIRSLALAQNGPSYAIMPSIRGLGALEGFLTARVSIYRWQYHHYTVIFHDLLVRLTVNALMRIPRLLGTREPLRELSFSSFMNVGKAQSETPWPYIDDGLIVEWLGQLRWQAHLRFKANRDDIEAERYLVMAEEILFRKKRRVVLWKDHIGYLDFAAEYREVFEAGVAAARGINIQEAKDDVGKLGDGDAALQLVLGAMLNNPDVPFQEWLWENGCPWTVVDYRIVQPFRRAGGRHQLSEMKVLGRPGSSIMMRRLSEVTSLLSGFGNEEGKELRFFAYRLLPQDAKIAPDELRALHMETRRELAEALSRWALENRKLLADGGVLGLH